MNRRAVAAALALAAAIAGYLYWSSDERPIRRLLDAVADAVSQQEGEGGVAGLAEVAGLTRALSPDATLEPGEPFRTITGAQEIVATVGRLRAVMPAVQLELSDIEITVDAGAASVQATARLTLRDRDGAAIDEVRDVRLTLEKRDAGWVITAARASAVQRNAARTSSPAAPHA